MDWNFVVWLWDIPLNTESIFGRWVLTARKLDYSFTLSGLEFLLFGPGNRRIQKVLFVIFATNIACECSLILPQHGDYF